MQDKKKYKGGQRPYSKPERKPEPHEERADIVVGRNPIRELLASGRPIDKLYVQKGEKQGSIIPLMAVANSRGIVIVECEKQKLDAMAPGMAHQGMVALCAEKEYCEISDILDYAYSKGEKPFVILLDEINDPHNLGAIIRSADCLGAHGIILPKRRSVGLTATVSKASAGALEGMLVAKTVNINAAIDELKEAGLWVYAADMDGDAYYDTKFDSATALVLGSEGSGVSRLTREKCDFIVSIPQYGRVNSLNVSNAAAIIMSEIARQRHT